MSSTSIGPELDNNKNETEKPEVQNGEEQATITEQQKVDEQPKVDGVEKYQ